MGLRLQLRAPVGTARSFVTTTTSRGDALAKPNFQFQKRQRELEKKRKQEEKRQRKLERTHPAAPVDSQTPPAGGEAPPA